MDFLLQAVFMIVDFTYTLSMWEVLLVPIIL